MNQDIRNINRIDAIREEISELAVKPFSRVTQKLINWFVFFVAFPSIELFGNSITFYLFIAIGIRIGSFWEGTFRGKILLALFLILAIFSSVLAPSMPRGGDIFENVKIFIQYTYWIFVAFFFIKQQKRINFLEISKWAFYGLIIAIIGYYLFNVKFGISILSFRFAPSRNDFVFNMLCIIPIAFYHIFYTWGKKGAIMFMPFFLLSMFFTGGRSGAILIILQLMLISGIIYPSVLKFAKVMIPILGLLFIVSQADWSQMYLNGLATQVESINPRFASLLRGQGEGDLTFDKSWLERKLMVEKGLEIFKEYPIRGIGLNNFYHYDSKLVNYYQYERLGGDTIEYYNTRSAHNSYIQVLAELGLLGLSVLIALIIIPLSFFLRSLFTGEIDISYLPLVSLLAISMHLYAITALTGANTWMIIGLSWAILQKRKHFK